MWREMRALGGSRPSWGERTDPPVEQPPTGATMEMEMEMEVEVKEDPFRHSCHFT